MVGFSALGGVWSGVRRHLDRLFGAADTGRSNAALRGRLGDGPLQPDLLSGPTRHLGGDTERRPDHLSANPVRSGRPDAAAVLLRHAAQPVSVLLRVSHDNREHVSSRPCAVLFRRLVHGDGRRRAVAAVSALDTAAPIAVPFQHAAAVVARRTRTVGRFRGLLERVVDGCLLHHFDPPLRGPGTRRTPPEGKDAGYRPVGGGHRPSDRQPTGRRTELPDADRPASQGRAASYRIRRNDDRGVGADRADGQTGEGRGEREGRGEKREEGRKTAVLSASLSSLFPPLPSLFSPLSSLFPPHRLPRLTARGAKPTWRRDGRRVCD